MVRAQLMGVVNVTPDSYVADSRATTASAILAKIEQMVSEGADWIDIGAESTAPQSKPISEEEELVRLQPLFEIMGSLPPVSLSIDTYKPKVAKQALKHGFKLLNDITGFQDPLMRHLAAESGALICVMHRGNGHYPNGIIAHLKEWFPSRVELLLKEGVAAEQIILDPGIGGGSFGKSISDNLEIIQGLEKLSALGFPLLVGTSRKLFLQQMMGKKPEETLPATLATAVVLMQKGVNILRVHDVAAHKQVLNVVTALASV